MTDTDRVVKIDKLSEERLNMLTGPGGSLSVVAMPVISEAAQSFEGIPGVWGLAADGLTVTLMAAPAEGITIDGKSVDGTVALAPGSPIVLSETVTAGVGREVDGTWFLMIADEAAPNLAAFAGVDAFDYDPAFAVQARYEAHVGEPVSLETERHGSETSHSRNSPGELNFTLDGVERTLTLYSTASPDWMTVNFRDETSGSETPEEGRILVFPTSTEPGAEVTLDFNQALLSAYESSKVFPCPVPPPGNTMPVAIRAGEKRILFTR